MRKNPDAKYGNAKPLMGWQILSLPKRTQFFKKSMPDGICRIGIRQPICKGRRPLKKVCLAAFAESEFAMGWQIPICQKERSPLKKVCLAAFAESEFGNPGFLLPLVFGEEKKLER